MKNNCSNEEKINNLSPFLFVKPIVMSIEKFFTRAYSENKLDIYQPVFIIGAPRTGSTIFYLLITNFWNVSFINNFHCKMHKFPIIGAILSNILFFNKTNRVYKSKHGKTKGLRGPSECGGFWYNWFPKHRHYVARKELNQRDVEDIRATVNAIVSIFQKPLFFKNLNCGQRIGALSEAFPEAFFIHYKRNPLFVAQSLLLGRERVYGDRKTWWSVMPKEYPQISDHDPEQQVVEQVYFIDKQIEKDLFRYYPDRHYTLHYEELVDEPIEKLEHLRNSLRQKEIEIECSGYENLPAMENRNFQRINHQTFSKLAGLVDEIYGK